MKSALPSREIRHLVDAGLPVIWRAHVGLDMPNDLAREAWRFLIPYIESATAYVFSRADFKWEGLDPAKVTRSASGRILSAGRV